MRGRNGVFCSLEKLGGGDALLCWIMSSAKVGEVEAQPVTRLGELVDVSVCVAGSFRGDER